MNLEDAHKQGLTSNLACSSRRRETAGHNVSAFLFVKKPASMLGNIRLGPLISSRTITHALQLRQKQTEENRAGHLKVMLKGM